MKYKESKKLTALHQDFVNKYVCARYDSRGLYGRVIFCEDEDIAIVRRMEDYDNPEAWGCVNMAHQLLVPFEYKRIWDYGRFLIAKNSEGMFVYNKMGKMLYEISKVRRTEHKAYKKLFEPDELSFRLAIRKMAISKSLYQDFYVLDNGLAFLQDLNSKVGVILFSKLKLPFEYEAVAVPQNGYTLAIKENGEADEKGSLYECILVKVKSQIKKEGSIHPTGISLFSGKHWGDVIEYFADSDTFDKECSSIVCYNEKVNIKGNLLEFFPFDKGLPNLQEDEYEEEPEEDDYDPWSRENYSYEEAMYDALGGEMEAIWNLD